MARYYRRYRRRRYYRRYRRPYSVRNNGFSFQKLETTAIFTFPTAGAGKGGFQAQQGTVAHQITFSSLIRNSSKWANFAASYACYRIMGISVKMVNGRQHKDGALSVLQGVCGVISIHPGASTLESEQYDKLIANNRHMDFTGSETKPISKYFSLKNTLPRAYSQTDNANTDPNGIVAITTAFEALGVEGPIASIIISLYVRATVSKL